MAFAGLNAAVCGVADEPPPATLLCGKDGCPLAAWHAGICASVLAPGVKRDRSSSFGGSSGSKAYDEASDREAMPPPKGRPKPKPLKFASKKLEQLREVSGRPARARASRGGATSRRPVGCRGVGCRGAAAREGVGPF